MTDWTRDKLDRLGREPDGRIARELGCPVCGRYHQVRTWSSGAVYCSRQCARQAHAHKRWSRVGGTEMTCATCGRSFWVSNFFRSHSQYYGYERQYCSQACYWQRSRRAT